MYILQLLRHSHRLLNTSLFFLIPDFSSWTLLDGTSSSTVDMQSRTRSRVILNTIRTERWSTRVLVFTVKRRKRTTNLLAKRKHQVNYRKTKLTNVIRK